MEQENKNCRICGRPLKNPASIERGAGLVCSRKMGINSVQPQKETKAHFDYQIKQNPYNVKQTVLVIYDLFSDKNPTMTVTNDIDNVLASIAQNETIPEVIIYQDSEGEWDKILSTPNGHFKGWKPLKIGLKNRIKQEQEALQIIA